jgi:outer membrane protein assembly factor BamB
MVPPRTLLAWLAACVLPAFLAAGAPALRADEWTQWGGTYSRNMISRDTNLATSFDAGAKKRSSPEKGKKDPPAAGAAKKPDDPAPPAPDPPAPPEPVHDGRVVWSAKLGSQALGNPTVAGGRVFVGTNNDSPRDPRITGDRGVLMCFNDGTGELLWQLAVPKMPPHDNFNGDEPRLGICSSPTVEGDCVYICTTRCEVMCLDVKGMADGNDGPYTDEGRHMAEPGKPPLEPGPKDADILWVYDLRQELGVWPQDATNCSVLLRGNYLYTCTSNGVDKSHTNIPSPHAPSFIVLDKRTGKLVARDATPNSPRFFHGNWSNPSLGRVGAQTLVFWGGGDGWCYAFDPEPGPPGKDGLRYLRTVWQFDANPPERKAFKYKHAQGPSEILSTPVFYKDRVYVTVGQDPLHGNGIGTLSCFDAAKTGDVTGTAKVWQYDKSFHRSLSSVAIYNNLLFVADYWGFVHCLDPDTGQVHWVHDLKARIWGSTLAADGKVYLGTEKGSLVVFAASKDLKVLADFPLGAKMYNTPIAVNGRLYIATNEKLFVVEKAGP